ncbi:MAG: gliding motility-associated-like protein, partial [Polaribacter sp.]
PYSYDWNDFGNGAIRTNLAAGVYDVTITDNVGCQQQRQIEVFNTPLFDVNPIVSHISCFSESDGAIQLNLVGGEAPVTVTWSDDASAGVDRFNLAPGTYQVSINDNSSCSIDRSFVVKEPAKLVLDGIVTDAIGCDNPNSGAIDLLVTGGKFPYTFDWNTGFATTEDLTNIGPDNYTVLVTDASGCQVSKQFTVVRQKPIIAEITTEISGNCDTKEVTQRNVLNVTGGISPYTITWSGGITSGVNNEIMDATENGIYTATITDALGCVRTESIDVLLPIIIGEPGFEYTSFGLKEYNVLSVKDPITFTNTTTGDYVSFLWDFGNGVTSTEFNPTYTYLDEGVFNVSLTVFYPFNCSYTINISLTVTKGYELVLPNGFTPNGDSINDVIRPIYKGMIDVEMSIYDTWGSLLYHEKSDKIKGWNGTLEGKEVENGNYIMVVKAMVFHGLVLKLNGPVTLIK